VKKPSKRDYALVDSLVNSACNHDLCRVVTHTAKDRYHGAVCPVVERIRAAWARIVAAHEPKKEKP